MKLGIFGPLAGLAAAGLIMTASTLVTPTDSPWRWLGFALAVLAFLGGTYLGYGGESKDAPK